MAKYKEIMSRVSVTPEMRERVLGYVESHRDEKLETGTYRRTNIRKMMRWIPAVAAACFLVVISLQIDHINQPGTEPIDVATDSIIEYDSLLELNDAMGFAVPEVSLLPFEPTVTVYTNSFGISRIDYYGADGENITLSVAKDDGTDISGDYNEYENVTEETINNVTVTLKGNGDTVSLAAWTQNSYAYSIGANPGVDAESMENMVKSVLPENKNRSEEEP